jgi:hypothetical protein
MMPHAGDYQTFKFNNLVEWLIDSTYGAREAPSISYSPAFAPNFSILVIPKAIANSLRVYGVIIIAICLNVSYI